MDKNIKEKVKLLKKEKKYDEIFREFGAKVYNKYVPMIYRARDLKKLREERKV